MSRKSQNFRSDRQRPPLFGPLIKAVVKKALFIPRSAPSEHFFFKSLLYLFLLIYGLSLFDETDFVKNPEGVMDSFLHNIHLAFHEAGHIVFMLFGKFMGYFGGTLMQLLVPLIILAHFIRQKDNFSASVMLWWLGHSLLDIAPYIYDAWDQKLVLLGGHTGRDRPGSHDWNWILSALGQLPRYREIAGAAGCLGKLACLLSFLWGGALLCKQWLMFQAFKRSQAS